MKQATALSPFKLVSLRPAPLAPALADHLRTGLSITICSLLRDCKPWIGFLRQCVDYLRDAGAHISLVLVEDGSADGTDAAACRLIETVPGSLIKFGPNPDFTALTRTEKLARLRNAGLEQCLNIGSDWTMFLDSNIYFRLSTPLEMIAEANALGMEGLLTPYTLGSYVRLRMPRVLALKQRNYHEQHYFDTYALELDRAADIFPACPFSTCRKCRRGAVDRYATRALLVRSAFGGLGLIRTATLVKTGARWPVGKIGTQCEHAGFCARLREASPGVGTYILTHLEAFCDRTA